MKSTKNFKKIISEHLKNIAKTDSLFTETLKKKNKNIDDCITYILNTVKASGCSGFADEEIFSMAIHYYDEDDLKPGKKIKGNVVVNHKVEKPKPYKMTDKDKEVAKADAFNEFLEEEKESLRAKKKVKKINKDQAEQPTLF